jgi:tetratricopeptide (TPR) repeat protein
MFLCALGSAIVTYLVQSAGRSVAPVANISAGMRIANAMIAYGKYLSLTFVPRQLAIFYPLPETFPNGRTSIPVALIAGSILLAVTAFAVLVRRRQPAFLVGWLWFIGTLIPVIGLVQVGSQAYADRYMYIPSIGIFIAIAFPLSALTINHKALQKILIACGCATIVAILPITWRQIGTWKNSITVMRHAADVVPNNYVALGSLGEAYDSRGDHEIAANLYKQALRVHPNDAVALYNLAVQAETRHDDQNAIKLYRAAIASDPNYAPAYNNYGIVCERLGQRDAALDAYRKGMKRDPNFAPIRHNLALALAEAGQLGEAIDLWHQALRINPNYADAHESLGEALVLRGQMDQGIHQLREALRIDPNRVTALKSLAWILATDPNELYQNGPEAEQLAARAAKLAPSDPEAFDDLAAAYAREGNFDQAIEESQKAADLARQQNQSDFAKQILARRDLYRSHRPFTSGK